MNIVVLAGGTSTEREISLISGKGIYEALKKKGHRVIFLDVFLGDKSINPAKAFEEEFSIKEALERIKSQEDKLKDLIKSRKVFFGENVIEICQKADIVFMALHGANGEDGKVQGTFDLMGIKYTGAGHLSSGIAMDKAITKDIFRAKKVPTPKGGILLKEKADEESLPHGASLPLVVKTCCGGSSVGVYLVNTMEEYKSALIDGFKYEEQLIYEEYIKGREFSVGVVDGVAYPVIEIQPKEGFYNYKNKYSQGATIETCPAVLEADLTKKMQEIAVMAYKALDIEAYCRFDFMMRDNGEMLCLEANTLPGMTPTSLLPQEAGALGISYEELCEILINISMKKYMK